MSVNQARGKLQSVRVSEGLELNGSQDFGVHLQLLGLPCQNNSNVANFSDNINNLKNLSHICIFHE